MLDKRRMMAPKSKIVYGNFGGYMWTPGPLVYRNGHFEIQETWNEVNSYGSVSGLEEGSTYFNMIDAGKKFDSRGDSYIYNSGDIDNANPLSFDGKKWIIPPQDAVRKLEGTSSGYLRDGATVNGNTGKHYCAIKTNITYAGFSNIRGVLFFPDNKVITGCALSYFDTHAIAATNVTSDQLNEYIEQGCLFFPFSGQNQNHVGWIPPQGDKECFQLSCNKYTQNGYNYVWCLCFVGFQYGDHIITFPSTRDLTLCNLVFLCRTI